MTSGRRPIGRVVAAEVANWARKYPLAPRYARPQRHRVRTADGVRLHVAVLPGPPAAPLCVVLVHGFANSSRSPQVHDFAHRLATRATVLVPDLRGHRSSGGVCTLGLREPLDVAACVQLAAEVAPGAPVVTVGVSLGGIAVLRHAGSIGGVAGTVAVSAPAWWGTNDRPSSVRLDSILASTVGRAALRTLCSTRVPSRLDPVPDAAGLLAGIAPAPTLVVHDPDDAYFGPQHAEQLWRWARSPKDLWLVPGAGHGVDVLTAPFAQRLLAAVSAWISPAAPASLVPLAAPRA